MSDTMTTEVPEPQPSLQGEGSPLEPQPSLQGEGSPLDYPRGITFEQVWAALMEDRKNLEELAKERKETERFLKRIGRQIGGLNNSFGKLAEHLVAPNIVKKFNQLGFNFSKWGSNVKFYKDASSQVAAEIDILLENSNTVIAVEVKARPEIKDINKHTKRMEVLRYHADKVNDNRKYYGAIAGAIMSQNEREYILEKGFYLIEQTGDTMKITVPEGFVPKEW